jgi:hypothetical protein
MTTTQVRQHIERFRLWASQSETLAKIPRVSDETATKGRAMADAYRHCADTLERCLGRPHQSPSA